MLDRLKASAVNEATQTSAVSAAFSIQGPQDVFVAELVPGASTAELDRLELGSIVELTGICLIETDRNGQPLTFRLLLPSADHVRVLNPPPFWQPQRLLAALCIALFALVLIATTGVVLARRNAALQAEIRERNAISSERRRLARELHDSLEQALTAIDLRVERVRKAAELPPVFRENLGAARQLIQHSHSELRHAIWDLRHDCSEPFDLQSALAVIAGSTLESAGVRFQIASKGDPQTLPPLFAENIFRIGQEAITNIAKHAGAGAAVIEITFEESQFRLRVRDDGRGIPENLRTEATGNHYGLVGMQERARRIGAKLTVRNGQETGCEVELTVPLASIPCTSIKTLPSRPQSKHNEHFQEAAIDSR